VLSLVRDSYALNDGFNRCVYVCVVGGQVIPQMSYSNAELMWCTVILAAEDIRRRQQRVDSGEVRQWDATANETWRRVV